MIEKTEMQALLAKVLASSEAKKIDWIQSADENYRCSFPRSSIVTYKQKSQSSTTYGIKILNDEGDKVGSLSANDWAATPDSNFEKLKRIYNLAESNALSIEETLKDILENL